MSELLERISYPLVEPTGKGSFKEEKKGNIYY